MKIRCGFVSNSSSSSFLIASKVELTKENLLSSFKIPEDSPIYNITKKISNCIVESSKKTNKENIINDYGLEGEEITEFYDGFFQKMDENNLSYLYEGRVSSDSDEIESFIHHTKLKIETKDLLFYKPDGY